MLVADLFCGLGGASAGIEAALDRPVDIAVNHDPEAIALHRANHPRTRHYCESIEKVDPRVALGGDPIDMAWFSPACQHHSRARGGKPVENKSRGLAWMVTSWAARVSPRVCFVENVPDFLTWGPIRNGRPVAKHIGRYYREWVRRLTKLGYNVDWRTLAACDYGSPTTRERVYVIASKDEPRWPMPSHGEPGNLFGLTPYRTAAECIDWSVPVPSIFDRDKELVPNTMRRIARGIRKFVLECDDPYFVGDTVPSLIQVSYGERPGQDPRILDIRRPLGTVVAGGIKHGLVVAFLARHFGGKGTSGSSMREPVRTVTTVDHHAIVTATLEGRPDHSESVAAFLTTYYGTAIGSSLRRPLNTATTHDRFALVMVKGVPHRITDIGMRLLTPRELARAQGFPDSFILDAQVNGRNLSKTAQVRMVGNSVCPDMAEAIIRANIQHPNAFRAAA
jgi:DNA (cytosine-5)-methyltransferase 1